MPSYSTYSNPCTVQRIADLLDRMASDPRFPGNDSNDLVETLRRTPNRDIAVERVSDVYEVYN